MKIKLFISSFLVILVVFGYNIDEARSESPWRFQRIVERCHFWNTDPGAATPPRYVTCSDEIWVTNSQTAEVYRCSAGENNQGGSPAMMVVLPRCRRYPSTISGNMAFIGSSGPHFTWDRYRQVKPDSFPNENPPDTYFSTFRFTNYWIMGETIQTIQWCRGVTPTTCHPLSLLE